MNIVDSSGWVEYFVKGANAAFFTPVVRDVDNLLVPSICIYEVFRRLFHDFGEESALQAAGIMGHGHEVALDRKIAIDAAHISSISKLAMADSIIYASTLAYDAILWTQDQHFKDLKSVKYIEKK